MRQCQINASGLKNVQNFIHVTEVRQVIQGHIRIDTTPRCNRFKNFSICDFKNRFSKAKPLNSIIFFIRANNTVKPCYYFCLSYALDSNYAVIVLACCHHLRLIWNDRYSKKSEIAFKYTCFKFWQVLTVIASKASFFVLICRKVVIS